MMTNRSQIRRCALNLIYALAENGGDAAAFDRELFWGIALEKETERYRTAQAKALLHATRTSADSARLLVERSQQVENAMHGDLTTAALREDVARYAQRSAAFESAVEQLRHSLTDKRRQSWEPLAEAAAAVMQGAGVLIELGEALLPALADAAPYRAVAEAYSALIRRRARMFSAAVALRDPLSMEPQKEIEGLQKQARYLAELRPAAEALADAVLAKQTELEGVMEPLLAHYTTERLDAVDKVILLIALYELRVSKLDVAIVVSEANALADAYSGSKSAPFIHGILAAAAKL